MRTRDDEIPPTEHLFRGLGNGEWNGDEVLMDAIDSEGSSCYRETYATIDIVAAKFPGVAQVQVEHLPKNVVVNGTAWEFFAYDNPLDDFEAHCEIRQRAQGSTATEHKYAKGKSTRDELKRVLAKAMRRVGPER